ncbi:hypothetical protein C2W62_03055 [Candidatus Entotheonella serta]|nr:hypothetical protein C2W62_03055 [Candidatus Entotheonella serta]
MILAAGLALAIAKLLYADEGVYVGRSAGPSGRGRRCFGAAAMRHRAAALRMRSERPAEAKTRALVWQARTRGGLRG